MSEVNLQALAEGGKDNDKKFATPMQEINLALKDCKFGRFHIRLLCTSLMAFLTGAHVSNSTAYLLPNAECDLSMNLIQKGLLNAMPYIGMTFSTVLAGFLTDTFGRKIFLISGYTGMFIFSLTAAFSQSYEVMVTAKFFEGLLFATSFSASLTLTSEFCHSGIRDRMMLLQSSFNAAAQMVVAVIAWGVLSQDWSYSLFNGYIVLNSWNFYLQVMSMFPLLAVIMYIFVPESPKYLVTQEKYDEARNVLIKIYVENTGKPAESYPSINIWKTQTQQVINEELENRMETSFRHQMVSGLHHAKPMFQKPLLWYLILICVMNFSTMVMSNVFKLWFPQLSTIVEHYSGDSANGNRDLCDMIDTYTTDLKISSNVTEPQCITKKSGTETYINSIILGSICLIPYWLSGILVNKVGKKNLLFVAGILACTSTTGLMWANTKVAVVGLFSLGVAVSQTMMSLFQAVTVEFFPTTTRTLAISIVMLVGRMGSLSGNIVFPILLNIACAIPFFGISGMMLCVTVLNFFLPVKKNK